LAVFLARHSYVAAAPQPNCLPVCAQLLAGLVAETAKLTRRIEQAVAELPDGQIIMSFPRAGRICAAQILAELGDVRERFQTEDQLAAEAGVCPAIQ
jgi:transposase